MLVPTPMEPVNLIDLIPRWQADAACKGDGPGVFFPDKGGAAWEAKRVCAGCPVRIDCLEFGLVEEAGQYGIWGGAGEQERRFLRRLRYGREHGPEPVEGCRCVWCVHVRRHDAELSLMLLSDKERMARRRDRPTVVNRNGSGATHGRRATQAKGCRCDACRWSASVLGLALTKLGFQTADLWAEWTAGVPEADRPEVVIGASWDLLADVMAGLAWFSGSPTAGRAVAREREAEYFERRRKALRAA